MEINYKIESVIYYRITINGKTEDYLAEHFEELEGGFLKVFKNGKWQIIDPEGHTVCAATWLTVYECKEGMIRVYSKDVNKFTFINTKNATCWPFIFDNAEDFKDGYAKVTTKTEEGYATMDGKFVRSIS